MSSNKFLQTANFIVSLPPSDATDEKDAARVSRAVTGLLLTEDWVALGIQGHGIVGVWTVFERDSEGVPDLVGFENAKGEVTTFNPNIMD